MEKEENGRVTITYHPAPENPAERAALMKRALAAAASRNRVPLGRRALHDNTSGKIAARLLNPNVTNTIAAISALGTTSGTTCGTTSGTTCGTAHGIVSPILAPAQAPVTTECSTVSSEKSQKVVQDTMQDTMHDALHDAPRDTAPETTSKTEAKKADSKDTTIATTVDAVTAVANTVVRGSAAGAATGAATGVVTGAAADGRDVAIPRTIVDEGPQPNAAQVEAAHNGRRWVWIDSTDKAAKIIFENVDPPLTIVDNAVPHADCDYLIRLAMGEITDTAPSFQATLLAAKKAVEETGHKGPGGLFQRSMAGGRIHESRTSSTAYLPVEDPVVQRVRERLTRMVGYPSSFAESMQCVNYQEGQRFNYHNDWFADDDVQKLNRGGQRAVTIFLYLNDDFEGGSTNFQHLGIAAVPKKGRIVCWYNVDKDGKSLKTVTHSGTPVFRGSKSAINLWVREKKFR